MTTKTKKIPMRMCVACRTMMPKNTMLRIVKTPSSVELDFSGKKAGRGAYICNNPNCINKCAKAKLLNKVFEADISDEVYAFIKEDYAKQAKD